jgi:hypothetical protein
MGRTARNSQAQVVLQANDVSEDEVRRQKKAIKKAAW